MAFLALFLACSPSPCAEGYGRLASGACVPLDDGRGTPELADTAPVADTGSPPADTDTVDTEQPLTDFELGDPLTTLGTDGRYSPADPQNPWNTICHLTDAEVISAEHGLAVCDIGLVTVTLDDGQYLASDRIDLQASRLAWDASTETAWLATREHGIYPVEVSDPSAPVTGETLDAPDHEDIAADGGRVLLAAREAGTLLLDVDGTELAVASADESLAVALSGDAALAVDGEQLVLYRLEDDFEELDRVDLGAKGRDLDLDGTYVGVALGGEGAAAYRIDDDSLVELGEVDTPGPAYGVAVDGEHLYVGAWYATVVAFLGDGEPRVLGHEDALQWSMGVGAVDGHVLVADWFYSAALELQEGVGGPELVAPTTVWVNDDEVAVSIENAGLFDLDVELAPPGGGHVEPESLTLSPGGVEAVTITLPDGFGDEASMTLRTNDPDEQDATLTLRSAGQSLGSEHPDFELLGFTPPSSDLSTYRLSDYRGSVVFLAYFSVT